MEKDGDTGTTADPNTCKRRRRGRRRNAPRSQEGSVRRHPSTWARAAPVAAGPAMAHTGKLRWGPLADADGRIAKVRAWIDETSVQVRPRTELQDRYRG